MAARIAAIRGCDVQAVIVVDVARGAAGHFTAIGHQRVRIRQRKTECAVIEFPVCPLGDGMARCARR